MAVGVWAGSMAAGAIGRFGTYGHRSVGWLSATVPGEVHRILEVHGILSPIDEGLGTLEARWVDDCVWYFLKEFTLDPDDLRSSIDLVFDRLELDARVFVNGQLQHNTKTRSCRSGSTWTAGSARARTPSGSNSMVDRSASAICRRPAIACRWSRASPSGTGCGRGSRNRVGLGTRLVTVGITGSVGLELRGVPVRIDCLVPWVTFDEGLTEARIACRFSWTRGRRHRCRLSTGDLPELGLAESRRLVIEPGFHATRWNCPFAPKVVVANRHGRPALIGCRLA